VIRRALHGLSLLLGACASSEKGPFLVDGTTFRLDAEAQQIEGWELGTHMFTSREACLVDQDVREADVDDCAPRVDRSRGQVRLAFEMTRREDGVNHPLPLTADDLDIVHDGRTGADTVLVPHDPVRADQLFIVLLDGSGSMFEPETMIIDRVYRALMKNGVKSAFFPDDRNVNTGVVLLRFTRDVTGLDGGPPRVIENVRDYETFVRSYLYNSPRGFTHLYDAVEYSVGPLLEDPNIASWLTLRRGEPTIIAITDGFNNEAGDDTCGTNAPRLASLLETLAAAQDRDFGSRPRVYTVGLGRAIRDDFDIERVKASPPGPGTLCGPFAGRRIDSDLETQGIDNPSLEWIAEYGKGTSYVESTDAGLAQVFLDAAAVRHKWYEVRYSVDPFHFRRSFTSGIRLRAFARAGADVRFYPSGWIDGPTPRLRAGSPWSEPRSPWVSVGLVLPIVAGLVLLHFLGPATFNGRRAITRRARGTRRK
jgi:hypothetical protein